MLTPAGHQPITFIASSGDFGIAAASFPAASGNVLSIGGTRLKLDSSNNYSSEGVWIGSQGGESLYEPTPAYQASVTKTLNRSTPDVAYDADPETGVSVYNTTSADILLPIPANQGWQTVGGTSMGSPQWAGLLADINQMRVTNGLQTLNGVNETLPAMYSLALGKKTRYLANFNDVAVGQNGDTLSAVLPPTPIPLSSVPNPRGGGFTGLAAKPGYDMVTGLGSPKVPALASYLSVFVPVKHTHRSARQRAASAAVAAPAAKAAAKTTGTLSYSASVAFFNPTVVSTPVAAPVTSPAVIVTPVGTPAAYTVRALNNSTGSADQSVLTDTPSVPVANLASNVSAAPTRSLALDGSRLLPTTVANARMDAPAASPDVNPTPSTAPIKDSAEPSAPPPVMDDGTIESPAAPIVAPETPAIISEPDAAEVAVLPPAIQQAVAGKYAVPMMLGAVIGDAVVVGRWLQRRTAKRRKAATPFGVALVTAQDDEESYLC
jgi:hypothetical protein